MPLRSEALLETLRLVPLRSEGLLEILRLVPLRSKAPLGTACGVATLSGLEPELSGPKPLVLPLHHRVT